MATFGALCAFLVSTQKERHGQAKEGAGKMHNVAKIGWLELSGDIASADLFPMKQRKRGDMIRYIRSGDSIDSFCSPW